MRLAAILLAVAAVGTAARADDRKEQAKKDVTAGLSAQAAGHYDEAIADYKRAYDTVPHPEILFDLAQAYRLEGDAVSATDYYERYLAVEPNGRVSKDAKQWVTDLKPKVAAQKADEAKAAQAHKDEEAQRAADAQKKSDEHQLVESLRPPVAPPPMTAPEPTRSHHALYLGLAFGGGGAAAATGLVFGVLAKSKLDDANKLCPGHTCASDHDAARANQLRSQSQLRGNLSTGFVAAGGVGVALGVFLLLRGDSSPDSSTAFAPVVTHDEVGFAFGSTW